MNCIVSMALLLMNFVFATKTMAIPTSLINFATTRAKTQVRNHCVTLAQKTQILMLMKMDAILTIEKNTMIEKVTMTMTCWNEYFSR